MRTTTLRKVGGSVMLTVPPDLLNTLRITPGAKVGIAIEEGRLIVEPRTRPRYTLDELLAKCDPRVAKNRKEREWLNGKLAGRELI